MSAIPLISLLVLTPLVIMFAEWIRLRGYKAEGENVDMVHEHVGFRLVGGVLPPVDIVVAAKVISDVLTAHYGKWWLKIDLVIEWLPYNTVIVGPFIKTGYHVRGANKASGPPAGPPYAEGIEKQISRVGGTIRFTKKSLLPWNHFMRYTVMVMDRRLGESPRSFLLGEGKDLPRADILHTPLFYEVCERVVPMGLLGIKASALSETAERSLEVEMEAAYKAAIKPA